MFVSLYLPADGTLCDKICFAASNNKLSRLTSLLTRYPSLVNVRNQTGNTPLIEATRHAHERIIFFLIVHAKADINASDRNQWTPLHIAAVQGNLKLVRYFVNCGAYLNAIGFPDVTPISLATQQMKPDVVIYLLSYDVSINLPTRRMLNDLQQYTQCNWQQIIAARKVALTGALRSFSLKIPEPLIALIILFVSDSSGALPRFTLCRESVTISPELLIKRQ